MTCNECLHFESCRNILEFFAPKYKGKTMTFTKRCELFKNKADYVEVKHGEWIECSNELNKYCSVCKKIHGDIYYKPPFCPNCGAKMDGGK